MRRKWWKAYFFLVLAMTAAGLALPLFVEKTRETAWWEWVYVPLYVVQVIGLFGFVYLRRVGVPPIWQFVFLASVAYEIWDLFSMATDSGMQGIGHERLLIAAALVASFGLHLPLLIGLYLYGFRCRQLWHSAT